MFSLHATPYERHHQLDLSSTGLGSVEDHKPLTRVKFRQGKTRAFIALALMTLMSSCVYHRRGSSRVHLFEYENQDAKVVFPWRTNAEFRREYELAIIASITTWFAYPLEALDGFVRLKIQQIFYVFPNIAYALENDASDVDRATRTAQEQREERERTQRNLTAKSTDH